jgi:glycosyltransferase involved in cell wall biosynthesis
MCVTSIPLRYVPYLSGFMYALIVFLYLPFYVLYSKPDIIITEPRDMTVFCSTSILLFPRSARPKIILDIRSTPVASSYMKTLLFNTTVDLAKRVFDGITIITPMMKKEVCDKFHINPKFVGVWSDGASTTLFEPSKYNMRATKEKLGLNNKFVIFYHGALGGGRGITECIKAIEMLRNHNPNIVLFLLGKGPYLPTIKEQIQKSRVQDRVIIHDAVDYENVPKFISMCDVGLVLLQDLPIWRNQCPLNLLEYLAMKKVVIATDIPAHREIIGKSECGIYISSTDPEEIARGVLYAVHNRRKLKEWGAHGRMIIEEKYGWEKIAKNFEACLLTS